MTFSDDIVARTRNEVRMYWLLRAEASALMRQDLYDPRLDIIVDELEVIEIHTESDAVRRRCAAFCGHLGDARSQQEAQKKRLP